MSKYQPKIIINNPEKDVPADIKEQFFLTIKSGDIDKIREFTAKYNNKYNIINKTKKDSTDKTPFHVVLELDDKIADNNTKLRIMEFLDKMGAPIDLPDVTDTWPIHLAASLQSEKILKFLIDRKVSISRKDSSNNTPLHYAINGKETQCPELVSVGSLTPSPKIDKISLNKSLEDSTNTLVKIISRDPKINKNLIHMIGTISKIPEMYVNSELSDEIKIKTINIFSDTALNPSFPSTGNSGLNDHQNKLELLVDETVTTINDELLKGLTSALSINPNNGGWGPQIPIINPITILPKSTTPSEPIIKSYNYDSGPETEYDNLNPKDFRPPNDMEKILENTRESINKEIDNEYTNIKNSVSSIDSSLIYELTLERIPNFIDKIQQDYIKKLLFCPECQKQMYGEYVGMIKMLYLLIWNDYLEHIPNYFAQKVINKFTFMSKAQCDAISNRPADTIFFESPIFPTNSTNDTGEDCLFAASLNYISSQLYIKDTALPSDPNYPTLVDLYIGTISLAFKSLGKQEYDECIMSTLLSQYTVTQDDLEFKKDIEFKPIDLYTSELQTLTMAELVKTRIYKHIASTLGTLPPPYNKGKKSWFGMLDDFITILNPRPNGARPNGPIVAPPPPLPIRPVVPGAPGVPGVPVVPVVPGAPGLPAVPPPPLPPRPVVPGAPGLPAVPPPKIPRDDVFWDPIDGRRTLPKMPMKRGNPYDATIIEWTSPPPGSLSSYTYYELFCIMEYISDYITTNDITYRTDPKILLEPMHEWNKYVINLATKNIFGSAISVGTQYPVFIFLYKILVTTALNQMRSIIVSCTKNMLRDLRNENENDSGSMWEYIKKNIRELIPFYKIYKEGITDEHLFNLLIPSIPNPNIYRSQKIGSDIQTRMDKKWGDDLKLTKWFHKIRKSKIDKKFIQNVMELFVTKDSMIRQFDYEQFHYVRWLIEKNYNDNMDNYTKLMVAVGLEVKFNLFKYLGSFTQTAPIPLSVDNSLFINNFMPQTQYLLIDTYERNLLNLTNKNMTPLFFLTETYGHLFFTIYQSFEDISAMANTIRDIIVHIVSQINSGLYYFIPQIFLPMLVAAVIYYSNSIFKIKENIKNIYDRKNQFYNMVDTSNKIFINIIRLGDNLYKIFNNEILSVSKIFVETLKYHDSVIEFLNYNSAYRLVKTHYVKDKKINKSERLFTQNLVPIGTLPNVYDSGDLSSINTILQKYKIPFIKYFSNGKKYSDLISQIFGFKLSFSKLLDPNQWEVVSSNLFNNNKFIDYNRSGSVSNLPTKGGNSQLNVEYIMVATDEKEYLELLYNPDKKPKIVYDIISVNNAIEGQWIQLKLQPGKKITFTFDDAFIAYSSPSYDFEWKDGMPASIKRLVGSHLLSVKQLIVENVVQLVVINKNMLKPDPELLALYDKIQLLGNETTYNKLDDVKIYIVVAKLVDTIINKILEYSLSQTVREWIYSQSMADTSFRNIVNSDKSIIDFIEQKDNLKLSLQEINKDVVDTLLSTSISSKYVDFKLVQIESEPSNLEYVTKPIDKKFIHYLYDINYYPTGNSSSNKKCYQINIENIPKLINGETIHSKNSDGNTPLHLAVIMNYPDLVEKLVSKGARTKGFVNLRGKDPYQLALENATQHLKYIAGPKVTDTIDKFVVPFNDLMVARLLDDKYKNNIVKNITLGIPVQLIIYNHMFHTYLENYRHGFTSELKNSINKLLKKYYDFESYVYPVDLLEINMDNFYKLISHNDPETYAKKNISLANKNKVSSKQKSLNELSIQLEGLEKERQVEFDKGKIDMIDKIIINIRNRRSTIIKDISKLIPKQSNLKEDSVFKTVYLSNIRGLKNKIDRNNDIVTFYKDSFKYIGNSNHMYVEIWKDYLNKNLNDAQSMIFPLLSEILLKIVNISKHGNMDGIIKSELTVIIEFFNLVREYIDSRNKYPNTLNEDDNPIYKEELNQIVYTINLILTPAIKNILYSHVYDAIAEMDGANTIIEDQNIVFDNIVSAKFNGMTIEDYLTNKLPETAYKFYSTIYSGSADPDRKIINSTDLFLPIIQIIKTIKIVQITDNSLLVQNLQNYLIPFISNTYQNFIHHLRLAIYGYERYLLNTYQISKILQLMV